LILVFGQAQIYEVEIKEFEYGMKTPERAAKKTLCGGSSTAYSKRDVKDWFVENSFTLNALEA
jgi:hypothetical protein